MKRYIALLLAALLCLMLAACGGHQAASGEPDAPAGQETPADPETPAKPEVTPGAPEIEALLSSMTTEEKAAQLFFVRCPTGDAAAFVARYRPGGLLLFGRDFKSAVGSWLTAEEFAETIAAYQAASAVPLFIGADEEGGTVARASRNPNLFSEKARSPQSLMRDGGIEAVAADALEKSGALLRCCINVNFAPVCDVSTDPKDFIYDRTLGQDAEATAEYAARVVAAMREGGVGSVLKHFPGYGNNADTHTGVAVDKRPYETFTQSDFLPFQAGIDAGADFVLVSHNIVECMDESLPASLSPAAHRVLRETLGFEGVILTDDLAMDAVSAYANDGSAAVLALLAGNDMLVTSDLETQLPLVLAAVEEGRITQELLDAACARVLRCKLRLGLLGE